MNRFAALALSAAILAPASAVTQPAFSADMLRAAVSDDSVCSDAWVRRSISSKFRYQVTHVPHLPDVSITDFRDVHLRRYMPASEKWPIARTYCGAKVSLSDGMERSIWYFIEGGMGFAGIGDNVEFCVSGFDRWYVYDGACRVAQ